LASLIFSLGAPLLTVTPINVYAQAAVDPNAQTVRSEISKALPEIQDLIAKNNTQKRKQK